MRVKRTYIVLGLLVIFIAIMHFVPVYKKTGYLRTGSGGNNDGFLCFGGDTGDTIEKRFYSLVGGGGGYAGFHNEKELFAGGSPCKTHVDLRLYLW